MAKRLTVSEQEFIKDRLSYWQGKLGQIKWDIRLRYEDVLEGSRAETECREKDSLAVITFSKQFDEEWDETALDKTCFHEVCEVKYWLLRTFLAEDIANTIIHEWIRTDENIIYPLLK